LPHSNEFDDSLMFTLSGSFNTSLPPFQTKGLMTSGVYTTQVPMPAGSIIIPTVEPHP
jgi:hypothetical protein